MEKSEIVEIWQKMAESVVGCEKGLDPEDRDCNECKFLKDCIKFHEECISCLCKFVADLIEGSLEGVVNTLSENIKEVAEKSLFGEPAFKGNTEYYT